MSTISVSHQHTLGQEEAMKRTHEVMADIGNRLKVDVNWNGPTATFKGTGFSGNAKVLANMITLDLDLSLLLRPMKGKIESRIERALAEKFT
jgi:putative polyhydroxyalkanoate system protein